VKSYLRRKGFELKFTTKQLPKWENRSLGRRVQGDPTWQSAALLSCHSQELWHPARLQMLGRPCLHGSSRCRLNSRPSANQVARWTLAWDVCAISTAAKFACAPPRPSMPSDEDPLACRSETLQFFVFVVLRRHKSLFDRPLLSRCVSKRTGHRTNLTVHLLG